MAQPQLQVQPSAPPPQPSTGQITAGTVIAQIALALATSLTYMAALDTIAKLLGVVGGLRMRALKLVLGVADSFPLPPQVPLGDAQRFAIEQNLLRRAAYIPTSMKRMERELDHGVPVEKAVAAEHRYFAQHVQAAQGRVLAAQQIDGLRWRYGDVLGWYAQKDGKTTEECRQANGKNFRADTPPKIGWPGFVHVNCRCYPGKPYPRGVMLP